MNWRALATVGCLLAGWLTAAAAFPPSETWYSSCERPIATCGHARPSSVVEEIRRRNSPRIDSVLPVASEPVLRRPPTRPSINDGLPAAERTDPFQVPPGPRPTPDDELDGVRAALDLWQAASRGKLPAGRIDRLKLAHDRPDLSGQMRIIARRLDGPVDAHRLQQHYDWSLIRQGKFIELAAAPRDRLERLLCPKVVVRLDAEGTLLGLTFAGEGRRPAARLAMNETRHRTAKIVPAAYEETPSDPPERLKTAYFEDSAAESTDEPEAPRPNLRRPDMELVLPKAPVGE